MFFPKACLFDLDGVLLDTEKLHGQAWIEASSDFDINLSQEQLLLLRGRTRPDCIKQILQWGNKNITIENFTEIHQPISKSLMSRAKAMPGAQDLIEYCYSQGIPMALVTSSSAKSLALKIAPHPWITKIKTKVLGDDIELREGKPAPDPFLLAAKRLKVSPEECWAIEDSNSGKKAALLAGCKVWVLQDIQSEIISSKNDLKNNPIYINSLEVINKKIKKIIEGK